MSRMWTPQSIEIYKSWVDALIMEASDELSQWEQDFVLSIQNRLTSGANLTESQANKLEQLYAAKTG